MKRFLLVVALLGCSPPAKPPLTPGQVVTLADGTLRTRDEHSIEIVVHREFADHRADGTVVLRDFTVDEAAHSFLISVARGRAWRSIVDQIEDPAEASVALQRAVEELGYRYLGVKGHQISDETSTQVLLAENELKAGETVGAVARLKKVLDERLGNYLRVYVGRIE